MNAKCVVKYAACLGGLFLLLLALAPAQAEPLPGAVFTTDSTCTGVDLNIYDFKIDVFLDGGPAKIGAAGLPQGTYYLMVTTPGGDVLGSSGQTKPIVVNAQGEFATCYRVFDFVKKASDGTTGFDDTTNAGGEYKVWVSTDPNFANDSTKTDNFKVGCGITICCPPDVIVDCVTKVPPIDLNAPVITNTCPTGYNVSAIDTNNGGKGCPGDPLVITRTYTVTDAKGRTASCDQIIRVIDNIPPVLEKGNIAACYKTVAEAEAAAKAATKATDNCSDVTLSASTVGTCDATITVCGMDACGNAAVPITYKTRIDNTPPSLVIIQMILEYQCLSEVPPLTDLTACDNCDGPVTAKGTEERTGTPCDMTIVRTWTATDTCGNTGKVTQTIYVKDTTKPVLCNVPKDVTECLKTVCGNTVSLVPPSASDNCTASPKVSGVRSDGKPLADPYLCGVTTVTWTATDDCLNVSLPATTKVTINGANIGVLKFFDFLCPNGTQDPGEPPIPGWQITVSGRDSVGNSVTFPPHFTGPDGTTTFTCVPLGTYTVAEVFPPDGNYVPTTPKFVQLTITDCTCNPVAFGNNCIGSSDARTLGFWSNKNGYKILAADSGVLGFLSGLNLVNGNGSAFDPASLESFQSWLLDGKATNMACMLSVQLAAMELNVREGKVKGDSTVYGPDYGYSTVNALMKAANDDLAKAGHNITLSGSPYRAYQGMLKDMLDKANNNQNFVQTAPCPFSYGIAG